MKIKALLTLITLALPALATANPSDSSLNKLADVVPYESIFAEAILAPIYLEGESLAQALAADPSLTDKQRTEALKTFESYAQNLIKELNTPAKKAELKKAYIAAAKQGYTQAEVDAQIAFYGSEVGKSALKKEEAVFGAYMKSVGPSTTKTIQDYQQKNGIKMQDNIKRILNK